MTIRILLACLLFFIVACGKSDIKPDILPEITGPNLSLKSAEEVYGIKIEGRDNYKFVSLYPIGSNLTINVTKVDIPYALVFDLNSKQQLSQLQFDPAVIRADVGYGQSIDVSFMHLVVFGRTTTHLYGIAIYKDNGEEYTQFVSEIKTNKIIENDPKNSLINGYQIGPRYVQWFDGHVLIIQNNKYEIIAPGNKVISNGEHESRITEIPGIPVSLTEAVSYVSNLNYSSKSGFEVYSIETNRKQYIDYDPKSNKDDRVEVKSISLDGKLAVFVFTITTYSGEVNEKTARLDLESLKVL